MGDEAIKKIEERNQEFIKKVPKKTNFAVQMQMDSALEPGQLPGGQWECPDCNTINEAHETQCEVCSSDRPP